MQSPDFAQMTSYASKRTEKVFPLAHGQRKSCTTKLWAKKYQYIQVWNFCCLICNLVITRKKLLSSAYLLGPILEVSDRCKMHLFLFWQYTSCLLYNYIQFQTLSARRRKNTFRVFSLSSYLLWNRKLQNLVVTRNKQVIWVWLDIK